MLGQEGAFPNTPPKAGSITLSELELQELLSAELRAKHSAGVL